jgi:hypothetical protein
VAAKEIPEPSATKLDVLRDLAFGARIAEEEFEQLANYFIETEQWRSIVAGNVDIVFGPKGSGKSAIYATLLDRADTLFDGGVLLVSAENCRCDLAALRCGGNLLCRGRHRALMTS